MSRGDDDFMGEDDLPRRQPARREDRDDDDDRGRPDRREDNEDMPRGSARRARENLNLPSIFMIIAGVINILMGGYGVVNGVFAMTVGKDQLKAQVDMQMKADPKQAQAMKQAPFDMDALLGGIGGGYIVVGALGILTGILAIVAGIKMRSLKGYGFCIFASVLSCIPCVVSCCPAAWIAGIWSIIVLLNADVKAAFR